MNNELNPMNYVSLTIDFLRCLNPNWDVDNNRHHLLAALRACGVNIEKRVDRMENMNVRYVHNPRFARQTTIFQGRMIENYPFASMYNGCEILDVNIKNDMNIDLIVDFLKEMEQNKKATSDFDFVEESNYEGKEGRDLKNQYVSASDKKKYKIMNKSHEQIEDLLQKAELFESPFYDVDGD